MTPELSYYWEGARERCENKKRDEGKKMLHRYIVTTTHSTPMLFRDFYICTRYASILLSRPKY